MYLYILKHGNAAAVSYYGSSGWCSLLLLFIDFRFGPVQFPFLMRIYINLFSFPIFFYFFFALFVCIDTLCVMCTHAAMDCHPRLTLCLPVRFIFSWLLLLLFIASREMRQKKKKKKRKKFHRTIVVVAHFPIGLEELQGETHPLLPPLDAIIQSPYSFSRDWMPALNIHTSKW